MKKFKLKKNYEISHTDMEHISAIARAVYERNAALMKEYELKCKIAHARFSGYGGYTFFTLDVFKQLDSVYSLCGKDEPFTEIVKFAEEQFDIAEEYKNNHTMEREITSLCDFFKDGHITPVSLLISINSATSYALFNEEEIAYLSTVFRCVEE